MARIAALGSSLQDIYLVDHDDLVSDSGKYERIHIGTKVDIDKVSYEVGGGATNAATTFVRHGHEAILLSNIGRDIAGEAILKCLDEEGIDNSYLCYSKDSTGCSVILLDSKSGERTILTHRGASARFDNISEKCLDMISPDWLYVTTLRGDMATLERFFKKAKKLDIKIMFNPGELELKHKRNLTKLLEYVDVLLVNKREAAEIVPGKTLTELLSRLKNYLRMVIITDGQMGAIATDGAKTFRFGLYEDLKVVDTTGAGDAFGSGFLAALAAGKSFGDSLTFASAKSTSVVSTLGAKTGILTGRERLPQMPIQEV